MEAMTTCVFNKFGFCKYGTTCRKKHEETKCENSSCNIFNCNKRHPRECKYFREFKRCKYNEYCRYEHKEKNNVNESPKCNHEKLEKRISFLENALEHSEKNIKMWSDKLIKKEEMFQELENKLNEFVNSFKIPSRDFMPFNSKEENNNIQSENSETKIEVIYCNEEDIEVESNESTDVEEIEFEDLIEAKFVGQLWNNKPLYISQYSADLEDTDTSSEETDEDEAVKSSKGSSFDSSQKEIHTVYSVFQNLVGKFRNIEYVLLAEYERAIE